MFCPNCGLQQADATNFCLRCGADLTKKRELYGEIAASASLERTVPEEALCAEDEALPVSSPADFQSFHEGQTPEFVPTQSTNPSQNTQRVVLPYLGLRRLCCFPTFLACLVYGCFSWLTHYEELLACVETLQEPSIGWEVLAATVTLVSLGLIQSLIGMGTLYSRQALSTGFVMSAACALIAFLYMPWVWKTRLVVFTVFALCAIAEAGAVIGSYEKKPKARKVKAPKQRRGSSSGKHMATKGARKSANRK